MVAMVSHGDGHPTQENARLIAAAPDLLEAVYILNHHANLQFPGDDPDYTKDVAFVIATINKAEGRA